MNTPAKSDKRRWRASSALIGAGLIVTGALWFLTNTKSPVDQTGPDKTEAPVAAPAAVPAWALSNEVDAAVDNPRAAQLVIDGQSYSVISNVRGEYPRVPVTAASTITASVPFPDAIPGERISVQAEDGGLLLDDGAYGAVAIDENRRAPLRFQAADNDGMQRVTLRRGGEIKTLEFWVGEAPPVLARK